jgi:glycerophosphoryl diester phosphodiesterase
MLRGVEGAAAVRIPRTWTPVVFDPEARMTLTGSPPLVIAHRGASAYRPENTLSAYALAVEQGADMIEIDLHRTRDGAIVIAHDADLGHLRAEGEIADRSLAEMKALDAGLGSGRREAVPTLDEVLDGFGQRIPFNLEIKWGARGDYPGIEAAALGALTERDLLGRTLFSSFRDSILARLRACDPGARLAVLFDPRHPERPFERARAVGAEAINPHYALATPDLVAGAHERGLAVYVYTVDDEDRMRHLIDLGVDGLFTNRPDRMRAVLTG